MFGGFFANSQSLAPFEFGNALQFDGVNDYVEFNSDSGPTSAQNFFVSLWFKTTSTTIQALLGGVSAISGCWIIDPTTIRVFYGNNSYIYNYTLPAFNDGNWHHIMFGRESDGLTLFFVMDGIDYSAGSTNLSMQLRRLGTNQVLSRPFNGVMDEVVIAYEEPTLAKALQAYNSGSGSDPSTYLTGSAKLIYHLNESGTTTTTIDDSGNGNNGTLNNFTTPPDYWVAH